MKAVTGSLALLGAAGAAGPVTNPHRTLELHLSLIKELNVQPLPNGTTVGKSASAGSYMTQIFETPNCQADSLYTASGYVFDRCIALNGQGYMYSDCSQGGGKTTVHMTMCSDTDCSKDCSTYPIALDTGCKTMSIMSCEASKEPWTDMPLNTHMEMYWGETTCGGDFDQWTAVNVDEGDCNDFDCYTADDYGDYAVQGYCDGSDSVRARPKGGDTEMCTADIGAAATDIAKAGIDIAAAVDDCADGFTPACNNDIDAVLLDLTNASEHITAAVYDCGGEEPTPCSEDVNAIISDLTAATDAITDAVVSCPISDAKCGVDITQAVVAIGKAAVDIARAVEDC